MLRSTLQVQISNDACRYSHYGDAYFNQASFVTYIHTNRPDKADSSDKQDSRHLVDTGYYKNILDDTGMDPVSLLFLQIGTRTHVNVFHRALPDTDRLQSYAERPEV